MLKDITLGQYFPGNTLLHRLDPRTKLVLTLVYIVALFVAKNYISYAVMLAFLLTSVLVSKVKPRALFKGLKPIMVIIIITAILNLLHRRQRPRKFWVFKITDAGIKSAVFMALRIAMLIMGTFSDLHYLAHRPHGRS